MAYIDPKTVAEVKKMDLLTYLRYYDPGELIHFSGNVYTTRSHDSLKISNGMWTWWSKGIGGRSALDYLIKVRGYSFTKAAEHLADCMGRSAHIFLPEKEEIKEEKQLVLPEKNENADKAKAYLKERGIDEEIINSFIKQDQIYQAKESSDVIFVGCDSKGRARYGFRRATNGSRHMGDCLGSDKRFSFRQVYEKGDTVQAFESAIDMLSFMSLAKMDKKQYQKTNLISLSGIYKSVNKERYKLPVALEYFLKENDKIRNVCLRLDNDEAGRTAAELIEKSLKEKYNVYNAPPPFGKDYNDYLKKTLIKLKEKDYVR